MNRRLQGFDAHIRRRLRALKLKHWKRRWSIVRALIALGASPRTAWRRVYAGRKRLWALSHDPVVDRALDRAYFRRCGLLSLATLHQAMVTQAFIARAGLAFRADTLRSSNGWRWGVTTRRPEEPYTNDVSTVLWELGVGNYSRLPDIGLLGI